MGSSMDSRYWVCPWCFRQFDWEAPHTSDLHPNSHPSEVCKKQYEVQLENERKYLRGKISLEELKDLKEKNQ